MEDKYIDLLLNRCLNFDNSKSLLISYDRVNPELVDFAQERGSMETSRNTFITIVPEPLIMIVTNPISPKTIWLGSC